MSYSNADAEIAAAQPARFGYALSIAGTLVSRLATLAVLILLPKELGLNDYGMFALVITLGEIIEMTSSNWYRLLLVRQSVTSEKHADQFGPGSRSGFRLVTLIVGAGVIAIAFSIATSYIVADQKRGAFAAAVACYIFAFIVFRLMITILQAQGRQNLIGIVELVRGILTFFIVMGAVKFGASTFVYASFGLVIATFLTAIAGLPAIRKGLSAVLLQRLTPGSFSAIGIPVIIATLLTYQIGWLDRLVIQHWMGPQSVGLYVAVIAIARQPVDIVLNAVNSQTFPVLMAHGTKNDSGTADCITGVLLSICIMGFGAGAAIVALADPLLYFALPAFNHHTTLVLVPLITAASIALGLKHFVFDNLFHAHGRNWEMLRWFAVVAFLTLGLTLILVPPFGPTGAATAFLLGSIGSLITSVYLSRRFCVVRWPISALLRLLVSAAIAGLAAWAVSNLDGAPWIRLFAGAGVFGAVYLVALKLLLNFKLGAFLSTPWNIEGLRGATP